MMVSFQINDLDWKVFKSKVGHGNVSECLRNYVNIVISKDVKEKDLKNQFYKVVEEKRNIDSQYTKLDRKLKAIEAKNKEEEEKKEKLMREQQDKMAKIKRETIKANKQDFLPK